MAWGLGGQGGGGGAAGRVAPDPAPRRAAGGGGGIALRDRRRSRTGAPIVGEPAGWGGGRQSETTRPRRHPGGPPAIVPAGRGRLACPAGQLTDPVPCDGRSILGPASRTPPPSRPARYGGRSARRIRARRLAAGGHVGDAKTAFPGPGGARAAVGEHGRHPGFTILGAAISHRPSRPPADRTGQPPGRGTVRGGPGPPGRTPVGRALRSAFGSVDTCFGSFPADRFQQHPGEQRPLGRSPPIRPRCRQLPRPSVAGGAKSGNPARLSRGSPAPRAQPGEQVATRPSSLAGRKPRQVRRRAAGAPQLPVHIAQSWLGNAARPQPDVPGVGLAQFGAQPGPVRRSGPPATTRRRTPRGGGPPTLLVRLVGRGGSPPPVRLGDPRTDHHRRTYGSLVPPPRDPPRPPSGASTPGGRRASAPGRCARCVAGVPSAVTRAAVRYPRGRAAPGATRSVVPPAVSGVLGGRGQARSSGTPHRVVSLLPHPIAAPLPEPWPKLNSSSPSAVEQAERAAAPRGGGACTCAPPDVPRRSTSTAPPLSRHVLLARCSNRDEVWRPRQLHCLQPHWRPAVNSRCSCSASHLPSFPLPSIAPAGLQRGLASFLAPGPRERRPCTGGLADDRSAAGERHQMSAFRSGLEK